MPLFPPSQEIETEIALELPVALRKPYALSNWSRNNQF